eukprot:1147597-Pelagomonas_calceolata.AAC.8
MGALPPGSALYHGSNKAMAGSSHARHAAGGCSCTIYTHASNHATLWEARGGAQLEHQVLKSHALVSSMLIHCQHHAPGTDTHDVLFFRTSQEGLTLNDAFSGFAKVAFYRSRIAPGSDLQPTLMYPPAPCSPFPMSTLMRQTHPPAPRSRALYPYTQALEAPHSHAP